MESKKGVGGWTTHKHGCRCRPCSARRREAEAIAFTTGAGGTSLATTTPGGRSKIEALNADEEGANLPVLHATLKGNSARERVAQWLVFRAHEPNITNVECARKMGISPSTLNNILNKAVREKWLVFDDPISRVEHEIIPKVLDNLSMFLDKQDKTVTIETAKGTVFKTYQEAKGTLNAPNTVLALKIETVDPTNIKIVGGHVVGTPRELKE